MNTQEKINATSSLKELCKLCNDNHKEISDFLNYNGQFPTFGGTEPKNTRDVWSWNETHVLLVDNSWYIEERCVCGEADFHCICK